MKKFLSIIICLGFLLALVACGSLSKQPPFEKNTSTAPLNDNFIAENDTYTLSWNEDNYGVILTNKITGEEWGTSPKESSETKLDSFGMPVKRHEMTNSVLSVYYHDKKVGTDNNNVYSYGGVFENGHIRCARIKNGVHVEYYFDTLEFMIPVDFVLYDDYVSVSVNTKQIRENSNIITSISLTPFFCSVENDTDGASLFIPSGSGALINTISESSNGKVFSAPVYGGDFSQEKLYLSQNETAIRMPVFGVDAVEKGMFAVIDSAADTALIEAIAGSESYGFSGVYSTFQVRGYTKHQSKVFSSAIKTSMIYSESLISESLRVNYYPLSRGNSNYSSMADIYRRYLKKKGFLKTNAETVPMNVEFIGGAQITKSFLGIPYVAVQPTTTLEQASEIITDLSKVADSDFTVNLKGFGKSGVNIGEIAGGFSICKNIGDKSQIKKLSSLCKKENISLFMDFDLIRFSESGSGFSTFFDDVINVGGQKTSCYVYDKATGMQKRSEIYFLLSPWRFDKAANKLLNKTKEFGIDGISLETMTSVSYSDYTEKETSKYYSKSGFSDNVSQTIKFIGNGKSIMASDANVYAAVLADYITNAPNFSDNDAVFSADVPFYQMIFKGYVPMFSESVNLAKDSETLVLRALESGCGLGYTLISKWDNSIIDSDYMYFHSSVYSDLKDSIYDNIKGLSQYYKTISNAHIAANSIISDTVRLTEFDNGVSVYVNYGDVTFETPAGIVAPKSFLIKEGA